MRFFVDHPHHGRETSSSAMSGYMGPVSTRAGFASSSAHAYVAPAVTHTALRHGHRRFRTDPEDITNGYAQGTMHDVALTKMKDLAAELAQSDPDFIQDLRSNYYVTDWFIESCCCHPHANQTRDQWYQKPPMGWLKVFVWLLIILFYILTLLWLSFGLESIYICENQNTLVGTKPLFDLKRTPLNCAALLSACQIPVPTGAISVSSYYGIRVASYIVGALPIVFLMSVSFFRLQQFFPSFLNVPTATAESASALALALPSSTDAPQDQRADSAYVEALPDIVVYCFTHPDAVQMYDFAAYMMLLTHGLVGILTLAADGATASYFYGSISAAAPCPPNGTLDLGNNELDRACACHTVFTDNMHSSLTSVSAAQLQNPGQIAVALLMFNMLYTVVGVMFIIHTFMYSTIKSTGFQQFQARNP